MRSILRSSTKQTATYLNRSRMHSHEYNGNFYKTGAIATVFGFVNAYWQEDYYTLSFIWNGTEYYHSAREEISEQALVRRAAKLAKEVVGRQLMGGES